MSLLGLLSASSIISACNIHQSTSHHEQPLEGSNDYVQQVGACNYSSHSLSVGCAGNTSPAYDVAFVAGNPCQLLWF